ncbi:MAG: AAA family ATPase, partial [Clostridium sp.]
KRNDYLILKFNFSGLITDTKEELVKSFSVACFKAYNKFTGKYNLELNYDKTGYPSDVFNNFLGSVEEKTNKPIYVIIDEYDHFANELLSFNTHMFEEIVSKTGFVRKFYEVLKIGTETIIDRIFATGVSPITLDSLTSGFNISSDITRDVRFNEMMGFTEEEVRGLIINTLEKEIETSEFNELIEELRKNYNGYLFSAKANKRLFNSDMILYYLKNYEDFGVGPEELIDKNIASDYGKLRKMFDLKNKTQNMKVLDSILKEQEVVATITSQFSMEKDFEQDDFKSLLFYLGMLTIDKAKLNRVILKVPNYAIKALYFDFFMKKLNESIDHELDIEEIRVAVENIALEGNNNDLIKVVEKTLTKLSNRDYMQFTEKYIKLIFLTYCFLSKIYLVKSEYEVESGYIDIALLKQANIEPTYFAIFELKYISKGEYEQKGEALVNEKLEEAINQLEKYQSSEELTKIKNLKKWAIVFVGNKCVVNKEIQKNTRL